ncbi:Legionella vir region protein (plasmid) [Legionella adelaidensis]|uniref:Legionella vir region protein n=1 Tax=Legionella adelaidensis TaxID=45056 RepID=A0A0W0R5P8_9GAMM|nr:hypothetical protein [Legionella adelaidensis]KTC66350.1 Legionella vir region protein [Legionella adelaidensis]VEH84948.1 Legionella vir region protein [Legionella adelaidensis]
MSSSSTSIEANEKRIDTLFTRFAAIYGQLWLTAYQNQKVLEFAKKEWSESLLGFDNSILKEALVRTKKDCMFPPALPLFVDYCQSIKSRRTPNIFLSVPHTPAKPEVVKYNIDKMKESLTKGTKEKKTC